MVEEILVCFDKSQRLNLVVLMIEDGKWFH